MRLDELGEFGLIARLTAGLEQRPDVGLGVGDDAAVLTLGPGTDLVATCDAQVEGQHFLLSRATPEEIGHKALAVNLSDIAAMGAEPRWALVSLLLPPTLDVETLDGIYAGMRSLAREHAVSLVGGNVAATRGPLTLDITLLGSVTHGKALTRAGAHPGDVLAVIGSLGAAAAGLLTLVTRPGEASVPPLVRRQVRRALFAPTPLIVPGRILANCGSITAMLDVSDGLAADLGHLCERSGVGAYVEAVHLPIDPAARAVAEAYGSSALDLALYGGEDYALLCAVRPDAFARTQQAVRAVNAEMHAIGTISPQNEGMLLHRPDGATELLRARGWDHLREEPEASHTAQADEVSEPRR